MQSSSGIESLWVLGLASKCGALSSPNLFATLLLLLLLGLSMMLLTWAYPGGPAWGKQRWTNRLNPIPGPRGFPLLGSINIMAGLAHRHLASTAKHLCAERLMAFSMGETRVIITSNCDVAKEILNSSVFADRPIKESAYSLLFHRAIGFAPYGVYWRTLRRIAATHMFCPKQISAAQSQRSRIAHQMVNMFGRCSSNTGGVCVRDTLKLASLNNMMCSVFGRMYTLDSYGPNNNNTEMVELLELVEEGYEILGKQNWSDHLPWLAGFDLQYIRFRCSNLVPRVNRFVNRIIAEHRNQKGEKTLDFVDVLLGLEGADKLSDSDMVAVLWEMIFRGTDTVAILIEWILARMVLHPDIQSKVCKEVDQIVGRSRSVTESDITAMVYLPAVIKETLRMHPPGPLLSWARLAITDTVVDGHHIPAGTTAMVNMWAITHDPNVWLKPQEFKPERFLGKEGDAEFSIMGSDLRLAPFGSGRRSCPGKALGLTTVTFWVASLLHDFEWEPSNENPVNLSEVLRLSCEMANPLKVKLWPRRALA
ncbi:hypothetical protein GIB67_001633 [Kingdonia uniflora]|uniref:Cytochrome P450 n=1 Tax=Kingdonia uniflora TaxID=39325 RepID=A0A7J7L103_9MAGN|nr:hypothetical protein GIB67_001633 [Kingdonia uniflora]